MDLVPRGGWEVFVDQHWKRGAVLVRAALASPLCTPPALFDALVDASDAHRSRGDADLRFYVGRGARSADVGSLLPHREDGSLGAYDARLARELERRDFGLVLNHAQAHDRALFERAGAFLHGLHAVVGAPVQNEVVVFVSRYRSTPFGVHKDACDNFLFGISGTKRMRVWGKEPPAELSSPLPSTAYDREAGGAQAFALGPGDMLYIPAGHYHVGEADDGLAAHASLIVADGHAQVVELLQKQAAEIVRARLAGMALPTLYPGATAALPREISAACLAYEGVAGELERALALEWARRRSAGGFDRVPACREVASLSPEARVRVDPRFPLVVGSEGDEGFCAAAGHVLSLPADPTALALFERLNRGEGERVADLLAAFASDRAGDRRPDRETITALLDALCATGALRVDDAP